MASVPQPPEERGTRLADALETAREFLWLLALGAIGAYAFFVALGAFSPVDVLPLSILVVALVVLWFGHALLAHRAHAESDPRLRHARERRGF